MQDFDKVIDRRGTSSAKWDMYGGRDVLPFWVADMDFEAPPFIIEALHRRIDHGIFGYTRPPESLTEAVQQWLLERYEWQVEASSIVWISGIVPGFNMACRAVGKPGDAVMMTVPVYYPFLSAPGNSERRGIEVPLVNVENRWEMDIGALESAATPDTGLFMLCNPQNPTGRIYQRQELEDLATFCLRNDMVICSDEIHCPLLLDADKPHIPIASLSEEIAQRTITLMAPTKTYNTPGLPAGFAVIPNRDLRRQFNRARVGLVGLPAPLPLAAAEAAYRDTSDWVPRLLEYLRGNRDLLESTIAELPGVTMTHVEGTYLAWLDMRDVPIEDLHGHFKAYGLDLSDGAQFAGPGYLRFNFGCPRSTLAQGIARFVEAVQAV
jgi:cystathionine beta-lyase